MFRRRPAPLNQTVASSTPQPPLVVPAKIERPARGRAATIDGKPDSPRSSSELASAESPEAAPKSETHDESLGLVSTKQPEPAIESTESEELGIVGSNAPNGLPAEPEEKGLLADDIPAGLPAAPVVPAEPPAIFAERTKPKTVELLAKLGGTERSQAAVEDGLNWLARHQAYDGHWGADCVGGGQSSRCEPQHACDGAGQAYEAAQTGLALLAFQAGGHYYFNEQKYSETVNRGLHWLVDEQSQGWIVGSQNLGASLLEGGSGRFQQHFMYEHAIAAFALCEACAVAVAEGRQPEPLYLDAATKAVRLLEKSQHADGGWRYTLDRGEQSDCSVSGWVMLALKTAQQAQIKVNQRVVGRMVAFFKHHRLGARTIYKNARLQGTDAMVGVGMLVDQFINHRPHSSLVEQGALYLGNKVTLPWGVPGALSESDYYLWYNCTLAMFQADGPAWERWNNSVRDHIIERQLHGEDCERGSWPPDDQWSERGGRVYSTALAVLTLEVYYRFQRLEEQRAADKRRP